MKMTTLIERKRLKDTIIENVSKNVKRVSILCGLLLPVIPLNK